MRLACQGKCEVKKGEVLQAQRQVVVDLQNEMVCEG